MVDKFESIVAWMLVVSAVITLWAVITANHAYVG